MDYNNQLSFAYLNITCDLNSRESCSRWKEAHKEISKNDSPLFSFMMATYNDASLLNAAINSLLNQPFEDWELVILDNSDQNPKLWDMVENAMYADSRIRGMKSDKNVGWPKAASICMQHLCGKYTTFLAADDVLLPDALRVMSTFLLNERPDILWVGNYYVEFKNHEPQLLRAQIPPAKIYTQDNRSVAIIDIMKEIYYNSFFHYMRVDFLKENGIDFFDPYYADCAGMTEAMAKANKMVSIDFPVYSLTMNTSQTTGSYTWNSYASIFANQWKSVKKAFLNENFRDSEGICYVAIRILNNLLGNITNLCLGHCRNQYMNKIEKTGEEILEQLENILCNHEIAELFQYSGDIMFPKLLASIETIQESEIEFYEDDINQSCIAPIVNLALFRKNLSYEQQIKLLIPWLMDSHNPQCMGFSMLVDLLNAGGNPVIWKYRNDYKKIAEKNKNMERILG